jgi:hypothetical protein
MIDIEEANQTAVARMMAARPILRDVAPARDVIPGHGRAAAAARRAAHHLGTRVWPDARRDCRRLSLRRLGAPTPPAPESSCCSGRGATRTVPRSQLRSGRWPGVTSAVDEGVRGRKYHPRQLRLLEPQRGYGKVLRYGAYAPEVLDKLRWMNTVMLGTILAAALALSGDGIDIRALLAESLHMGDEGHNRNKAGSILYTAKLAPLDCRSRVMPPKRPLLKFLSDNALSVLNPVMAACKAMADAGHGVEGSTIMTTMARNGTDLGIRVSGLGDRWFTGPAGAPDGLYFPGFTAADASGDIGDSTITETAGIGAFAMAAAPAIVTFISGTPQDGGQTPRWSMYEITVAEHTAFTIPALGFRGTRRGVDIRKVVELGITPRINTGIAHREAGVGQVGAGLTRPPMSVFEDALVAFAERYLGE